VSADEAIPAATSLGKPTPTVPVLPGGLSPREQEVALLITRGLTNRQIAGALIIGERTVHAHVTNILDKLELISRTQIAAWGVEQGSASARPFATRYRLVRDSRPGDLECCWH
jgi:DNA-binding NarL/FixJ family response regulator